MADERPQHFDEAFLSWLRERTEETWQRYQIIGELRIRQPFSKKEGGDESK